MARKAWSQSSGPVPSDRIRPPHPHPTPRKRKESPIPKSREVVALEDLHSALSSSTGKQKDPHGGCFCQARDHRLSPHNPICRTCGLVLCELNAPHHCCPHCSALLYTPAARSALSERLTSQISRLLAKEAEERERAAQEARAAVGAFPPLPGGAATSSTPPRDHKVLSLNPKTKKVTVVTNSPIPPTSSLRPSRAPTPEPVRVPAPPKEVVHAKANPGLSDPWINLMGPRVLYVPPTAERGG